MSAKPSADVQTSLRWVSRCKGSEKNVYVQEKFTFFVIGYIFFTVASRIKVPSKVVNFFELHKKNRQKAIFSLSRFYPLLFWLFSCILPNVSSKSS